MSWNSSVWRRGVCLHHLQRHVRCPGSCHPAGDHRAGSLRHRRCCRATATDGRIHPYAKQVLASPALVVVHAIAGTIRFDIENDAGVVDGQEIASKDIWPSDERSTPWSRRR